MNPIVASLLEFNEAFEIPKLDKPDLGPEEMIELRIKLLKEEVEEYAEAARAGDLVEVLDALADIGYILALSVMCGCTALYTPTAPSKLIAMVFLNVSIVI